MDFKTCMKELNDEDQPEIKLEIEEFLGIDDKSKESQAITKSKVSLADFELMKLLGYGTYGRVFLARKRNNGKIYAIKVIDKKNIIRHSQSDLTKLERKILKTIKSRFLIKLYYAFQSKTKLFLVIEYCPGGEFYYYLKILKSFHEKTVKFYALNILFGLKALHDNNIGKHFTLGSPRWPVIVLWFITSGTRDLLESLTDVLAYTWRRRGV
mmetsp:Transcript_18922/g.21719  ORF Transcript_18922/g.21719 Transcript_18922/m.21719 type:complete len:211 (-) Transcript_18922:976-1608(-)